MVIAPNYTAADAAHDWERIAADFKALEKAMNRLYSREDQATAQKLGIREALDVDLYSPMLAAQQMAEVYRERADAEASRQAAE